MAIFSVTANIAPRQMSEMCEAAITGDLTTARKIHLNLLKLHQMMFLEPNPVPVKWALHQWEN
jgi:4-hydroxy-tetrahydrodipicolinate synthase